MAGAQETCRWLLHLPQRNFCVLQENSTEIKLPNLDLAVRPVPHLYEIPVPVITELPSLEDEDDICEWDENQGHTSDTHCEYMNHRTWELQQELNDLIRDLGLPKELSELLASRLKEKNML